MAQRITAAQKQAREFVKINGLTVITEASAVDGTEYVVSDRTGKTVASGWTESKGNLAKFEAAEHAERVLRVQAKRALAAITGE
jgi:hypothetical protein